MWRKTLGKVGFGVSLCAVGAAACGADGSEDDVDSNKGGAGGDASQPSQNPSEGPDEPGSGSGGSPQAGAGGSQMNPGSGSEVAIYATCEPAERVGQFRLEMTPMVPGMSDDKAFSSVLGKVENGIVPVNVVQTEEASGDCELVKAPSYSCDPTCSGLQTCGPDGCIAFPESQDVGTVSITGLHVPLEMEPRASTKSYSNPVSAMLPHPAMEAGADVVLTASGGDHASFTIRGVGILPLEFDSGPVALEEGKAAVVQWGAASDDPTSRVALNLNIDNHGSTAASIRCETADDGEAEIPAELVDALLEVGFSGFPTLAVRRQFASTADSELGCVEMLIASEFVASVEIEGLVSCGGDDDCPEGQTCQESLLCE